MPLSPPFTGKDSTMVVVNLPAPFEPQERSEAMRAWLKGSSPMLKAQFAAASIVATVQVAR